MPRIGVRGWIHSGVKVYDNTAAPTSWTDLDLSVVVGKNRALVFLKVKNTDTRGIEVYWLRTNGETLDVCNGFGSGCANSLIQVDKQRIVCAFVETDSEGVMEWHAETEDKSDISVLGYIR